MKFDGKVIKYGDDVDTDVIIPARYLNTIDKKELASHCMEDLDADFQNKVKTASIIVAGKNFGCGSSREQAPISLKQAEVGCIVAQGFARIFRRNSINIGLPVFVADAVNELKTGDIVEIDLEAGTVTGPNGVIQSNPLSESVLKTLEYGGLIPRVRAELGIFSM